MSRQMTRRSFLGLAGAAGVVPSQVFAQASLSPSASQLRSIRSSFVTTNPADFIHPTLASSSVQPVGVKLLCAFDGSSSVDNREFSVQQSVTAEAIRSSDFREAVYSGPGSIAIAFMVFGSRSDIVVPWIDIRADNDEKFEQIATIVEKLPREETGSTYHVKALHYAMMSLGYCPWQAQRGVLDFMTDGKDNDNGFTPREAYIRAAVRQLAEEFNTTVNTLLTINPTGGDADLESWANENLLTPAGYQYNGGRLVNPGFSKVVAFESTEESQSAIVRYEDEMRLAFKEKLIQEVAGDDRLILPNRSLLTP